MTRQSKAVLVVDDDPLTCRLIEFLLQGQGYGVVIANDPQTAVSLIQGEAPSLVLLDVQLPRMDGFTLLRHIKGQHRRLPVIMLTAKAEMADKLTGLDAGADDYIVKPFEPAELLARVKAVLRRSDRQLAASMDLMLSENGVELDVNGLSATIHGGEVIYLTPMETRILHRLMANPNHVVSRDDLTNYAIRYVEDTSNNRIDVYIGRIRRKLGDDPNNPRYIATVRGSGYKFLSPSRLGGTSLDGAT